MPLYILIQEEISTHLNVHHTNLNNNCARSSSSSNALGTMRNIYARTASNGGWHHSGTDVHHALLGKSLSGSLAYLGVLCNSNYGYRFQKTATTAARPCPVFEMKMGSSEYIICDLIY